MFSDEISVITLFKCFIALKTIKISEILQAQNSTHTLAMPVNIHTQMDIATFHKCIFIDFKLISILIRPKN